jgi:CHAD domain-containing protein
MVVALPGEAEVSVAAEPGKNGSRQANAAAPTVARERELKLAAPPTFRLGDLGGLGEGIVATPAAERRLLTVYWDTPDLRLIRWGCSLRYRRGEGWTVKLPDPESAGGGMLSRFEHTFPGSPARPPEAAVDLLRAYVRTARVVPVARMRTVRRVVQLHGADGQRLGEIDDDEVSVYDGRRIAARFREIEVELDESAPTELLTTIAERLHAGGEGAADPTPKLVRALGARALEAPEVVVAELGSRATAGDVVRRAIASSVVRLMRHDAGVRTGRDPEDVHQARVATRRLRSDLRTFRPFVDREWGDGLRNQLRELAAELGAVRDTEVLQDRLRRRTLQLPESDQTAAEPIVSALDAGIQTARRRLRGAMRSDGYADLLDRLVNAARSPQLTDAASARAREVITEVIAHPWRTLRNAARDLDESAPDEQLHDLRIRAKRCRYAAEAVASVVGKPAAAFARAVAALQEVLGDQHDAVVAEAWLRERMAGIDDPQRAFVDGELCALERVANREARAAWRGAWSLVSRKRLRAWM